MNKPNNDYDDDDHESAHTNTDPVERGGVLGKAAV